MQAQFGDPIFFLICSNPPSEALQNRCFCVCSMYIHAHNHSLHLEYAVSKLDHLCCYTISGRGDPSDPLLLLMILALECKR